MEEGAALGDPFEQLLALLAELERVVPARVDAAHEPLELLVASLHEREEIRLRGLLRQLERSEMHPASVALAHERVPVAEDGAERIHRVVAQLDLIAEEPVDELLRAEPKVRRSERAQVEGVDLPRLHLRGELREQRVQVGIRGRSDSRHGRGIAHRGAHVQRGAGVVSVTAGHPRRTSASPPRFLREASTLRSIHAGLH